MEQFFTKLASRSASLLGEPMAFVLSMVLVLVWAASGPFLHWSDTWQLIVNTATTVLTFLAVFLIQNSQDRDGAALQAKLDEVLRAVDSARSEFIGIEHLTEKEICAIRDALEREVAGRGGKEETADDTVERLLKRLA
jgi:low affinity Fe/Cu permease